MRMTGTAMLRRLLTLDREYLPKGEATSPPPVIAAQFELRHTRTHVLVFADRMARYTMNATLHTRTVTAKTSTIQSKALLPHSLHSSPTITQPSSHKAHSGPVL